MLKLKSRCVYCINIISFDDRIICMKVRAKTNFADGMWSDAIPLSKLMIANIVLVIIIMLLMFQIVLPHLHVLPLKIINSN